MSQNLLFTASFEVRDYECDLQGIVNNAVYLNYLEHARHLFLKSIGVDFAKVSKEGVNLVVARAEVDYKAPLRSGDQFIIELKVQNLSPLRVKFLEDIFRLSDGQRKLILKSVFVCTGVNRQGKLTLPQLLKNKLFNAPSF